MGVTVKFLPPSGPKAFVEGRNSAGYPRFGIGRSWEMDPSTEHWTAEGETAKEAGQEGAWWVGGDKVLDYIERRIDELWSAPVDWKRVDRKIHADMVTKERRRF